jgi:predicted metal-dependent HD superfamily phosphohydrolase
MCAGGVPLRNATNPIDAVLAALQIQDYMQRLKHQAIANGTEYWDLRLGINTGEVTAGVNGTQRFAYDIWGDAVNTASRMESNGLIGKVNISESTYNLIKDDFNFEYRGEIETKGKGGIKMYLVENKTNNMDFEKAKDFILNKLENELSKKLDYHNLEHILDVYNASIQYAKLEGVNEEETILLRTASLFHDSGFIVKADGHEQISCEFAEQYLPNFSYSKSQIEKIKGMIMATKIPQSPKNHLEEILADADLDYLGRDDFEKISERLFQELALNDRNEWNKIQISFFEKHNYFTDSAKRLRNEKKQENLEKIKAQTKL